MRGLFVLNREESEEWRVELAPGSGARFAILGIHCYRRPHPPLTRSPFPYEGKALTPLKLGRGWPVGRDTFKLRRAKRCHNGDVHSPSRSGLRPSPCRRRGTAVAVDEVCDSNGRPTLQVKPILDRVFVLPLEGKGDRSAVDEVTCTPAPLREASKKRPIIES